MVVVTICLAVVLGAATIAMGLDGISSELVDPAADFNSAATLVPSPTVSVLGAVEERVAVPRPVPTTVVVVPSTASVSPESSIAISATTTSTPPPTLPNLDVPPEQPVVAALTVAELGVQADAILGYPWTDMFPGWTVAWEDGRDGVRALTFPDRRAVEMYVRDGDDAKYLARVLAHELGHVADIELNSDDDRDRWREARGLAESVPWWPTEGAYDFDTAAGDFAEGFATFLVGSVTKSNVAGPLTDAQLAAMEELVS